MNFNVLNTFIRALFTLKSKLIKGFFVYFPVLFIIIYGVLIISNTMSSTEVAEYVLHIYYSISRFLDGFIPVNFISGDIANIVSFAKTEEFIQMVNLSLPSVNSDSDIIVLYPFPDFRQGLLILKDSLPNPQDPKVWLAIICCFFCFFLVRWILNKKTKSKSKSK